jgi:hypothetical protein
MGTLLEGGKTDCHEQAEARREVANTGMKVESLLIFLSLKVGNIYSIYTQDFHKNPKT